MSRFLETAQFLRDLNALWDEHAAHITTANKNLSTMLKTASKIPSEYITSLKKVASAQEKLMASSSRMTDGTIKAAERQRLAELKLQLAREKAFDKYEKQLQKEQNSVEAKTRAEVALSQKRDEALKRHDALVKASIELEERKQAVMNKTYSSAKEISKLTVKQTELNSKIKESTEAVLLLDKALHKTGSSSKLPGADTRINANNNSAKQAAAAAKEQERAARETNKANEALNRQAAIAARMAEPYNRLKAAHVAAESTLRNLIASETASNKQIRTAQKEFDLLSKKIQKADNAVGRLSSHQQGIGKLSRGIGSLMGAFGISTGLYLGASIIKDIYETSKELQSLDLALKMVSGTAEEFNVNKLFISEVASKWGLEIKSLTQTYTQFYTASKGLLAADDIKTTFEGIAKAGSIMGLSLEKQQSAFYAFDQMMSKGTVTAEELKKQLGNAMPGAIKAAAMAYMDLHPQITSIQQAEKALYADMKKGAIDSATYVPLIVKNFQKLYGIEMLNKVDTLQASQNRMSTSWTELVRSMNESPTGGISVFLNFVSVGITNAINLITRYNTEWNKLNGTSRDKGKIQGGEAYDTSKVTKAKMLQDKDLLMKTAKDMAVEISVMQAKFKKEGFFSEINPWSNTGTDIEKKMGELGQLEGAINKINDKLNPKKKAAAAAAVAETDKEMKARIAAMKKEAKEYEQMLKDQFDAQMSNFEMEKTLINEKMLLKNNNYSENVRLAAELGVKEQEIAKFVYDEDIRLAGSNSSKKIIADNNYYEEKLKLAKDYVKRIAAVEFKPQYKDKNKVADEEKYGSGVFETDESTLENMVSLWDRQQDEKDKIAAKEEERMKNLRQVYNDIFSEFGKATGFEKTMDMFGKISRNGKTFWENLTGGKDGEMDLKEGLTAGLTITQDVGNKIAEFSDEKFKNQRDTLDAQKEIALTNAGDSAAAKLRIEEEYNKKSKEIDTKQAIAKKKQAMFNIALDTAQAIMGLWVNPGFPAAIPMTIAVGALGALQLAMAASSPIPSFYTGTDNAPGGFANTDERGAEIHTDKHGKIKDLGSNKGSRVKYLNKGDKIIPASKTASILNGNEFSSLDNILSLNNILYNDNKDNQLDTSGIISSIDSLAQTIINKESSEEHYDVRGWTKFTKRDGQRIEEKNNRIRFKKSIL